MKDRNYFPFERNRYFYGKLLSVEDFQREQAYMNHKRRLLNRLLYGDGVLCGMQVLAVDEESITIEMGVALDTLGREIVIEQPVLKKLAVIDGFDECCAEQEGNGTLYLCIAYQEEEAEPVHSIGGSGNESGKNLEYNKWKEGYRLFLTSEEPEEKGGFLNQIYEEEKTIYQDSEIQIRQVVPRFLEKNQESAIRLLIDKKPGMEMVAFRYEIELIGADSQGKKRIQIVFQETDWEPAAHYTLEYKIRAAVGEMEGSVRICSDSFVLELGAYKQIVPIEGQFRFQVISDSRELAVWNAYYEKATEDILYPAWEPPLYLAKLFLIPAGDTYVLEGVESLPYKQYIWNNRMLGTMKQMELENRKVRNYAVSEHPVSVPVENHMGSGGPQYASGTVELSLGIGGTSGQSFYSEEIIHGLGPGVVFVTVGAVCRKKQGREIIYGTRTIFPEEKGKINLETAIKLYMDRGSFVVGVRCLEEIHEDSVTLYWLAVREQEDMGITVRPSLMIRPNMPRIRVRETVHLEAMLGDEPQTGIRWEVKDAEGGDIDEAGQYTAPNRAGIYEIRAYSPEDSNLEAMAYVIVGEEI